MKVRENMATLASEEVGMTSIVDVSLDSGGKWWARKIRLWLYMEGLNFNLQFISLSPRQCLTHSKHFVFAVWTNK